MSQISKRILSVMLSLLLVLSVLIVGVPTQVEAASTGYTSSSDVEYVTSGKYIANWGARNETCTFLSPNANSFYTEEYRFDTLSQLVGGTGQFDAPDSELFEALQALMKDNHKTLNSYGDTRYLLKYTDCELSDTSTILSFYSGDALKSTWDSGNTWNREHVWPSSKCLHPGHNNNTKDESTDIMMIRPTSTKENGSRGNKAYGLSSGYFTPDEDVRGDCARIFLYMYVRWGITEGNGQNAANGTPYTTWGTSGVMESLEVLLQWMEEDPVDTWEMGRNDAVQSITGTRNVFVDYPEYAWLLFGLEVPSDLVTPSGSTTDTSELSGWVRAGSTWCFYVNGTKQTGWQVIGGSWYYFDANGIMQTGWVNVGGTYYYMSASGAMVTGWVYDGGTYYYMAPSGAMQIGWVNDGSAWYYMSASGAMQTGWVYVNGTYYYMAPSGAMQTGWVNVGGTWYYMSASGAMVTGWLELGGVWYYLDASGAMACSCTLSIGGVNYSFNASGVWIL